MPNGSPGNSSIEKQRVSAADTLCFFYALCSCVVAAHPAGWSRYLPRPGRGASLLGHSLEGMCLAHDVAVEPIQGQLPLEIAMVRAGRRGDDMAGIGKANQL